MDTIKKKLIKDKLFESTLSVEEQNSIIFYIEKTIDSTYMTPNGMEQSFNKWIGHIPNGQLFKVVKTQDTFTAVPYKE